MVVGPRQFFLVWLCKLRGRLYGHFFPVCARNHFCYVFYDTGNNKKKIYKKNEKFSWCTQFSFGDLKIIHFSQFVITLVCKEHKFLIYVSQCMLLYVLIISLYGCWHYKVIWLCSGGSLLKMSENVIKFPSKCGKELGFCI